MRTHIFPLAGLLALAIAIPARAAEKPRPAQSNQTKKIWTDDDLDRLRSQGLISIVGPEIAAAASQPAASASATFSSHIQDPAWYRQQAADLQEALDKSQAALREAQAGLAQAKAGHTQGGLAMDKGNPGITPESGISLLEAQVNDVQSQIDELSDLARRSGIPQSALRR